MPGNTCNGFFLYKKVIVILVVFYENQTTFRLSSRMNSVSWESRNSSHRYPAFCCYERVSYLAKENWSVLPIKMLKRSRLDFYMERYPAPVC